MALQYHRSRGRLDQINRSDAPHNDMSLQDLADSRTTSSPYAKAQGTDVRTLPSYERIELAMGPARDAAQDGHTIDRSSHNEGYEQAIPVREETLDFAESRPRSPMRQSLSYTTESALGSGLQTTKGMRSDASSDAAVLLPRSAKDDSVVIAQTGHHKDMMPAWMSLLILMASMYSTVFSGIYLGIALTSPRYGRLIHTRGVLTISGATIITTFLSKTIEMTFVTVMLAVLGQMLTKRARSTGPQAGITMAELDMRSWIVQPGTFFTNWRNVAKAGPSRLGIASILAAILTTLYVTAANALVQPQLLYTDGRPTYLKGLVKTAMMNPTYIKGRCQTPISPSMDPAANIATCYSIASAARAFHNYYTWMEKWTPLVQSGDILSEQSDRPKGYALLTDNTTVVAPWVEVKNTTKLYEDIGKVVFNVTLAMPHAGVIAAATDTANKIMQPEDLDGLGTYAIHASVPSPMINVICASLTESDLAPLVYDLWPNTTLDSTTWPNGLAYDDPYLGSTELDDIFGWGLAYGEYKWPPVFPKLPIAYNTVVNDTVGIPYGRSTIYMLGNSNLADRLGNTIYPLCQAQVSLTAYCSTLYNVSLGRAVLEARCEDPNNFMAYIRSLGNATTGNTTILREWPSMVSERLKALALNDGINDANGSNSRLLTQLTPTGSLLDFSLPSIAEAFAVMLGDTLLQGTEDAPFLTFWNYSALSISPGAYQYFNASIEARQYGSGGSAPYQRGFLIVLLATFVMNCLALAYLIAYRPKDEDATDPSRLFIAALTSPQAAASNGKKLKLHPRNDVRVKWFFQSGTSSVVVCEDSNKAPEWRQSLDDWKVLRERFAWIKRSLHMPERLDNAIDRLSGIPKPLRRRAI